MRSKLNTLLTIISVLSIVLTTFSVSSVVTVQASDGDGGEIYLPITIREKSQGSKPGSSSNGEWAMAGANPQRTSWTSTEIKGKLNPVWYRPFEPYIPQKIQIIAAYNTLYISTANGLYALDADSGQEKWVYPTSMPLGHSPTIADGVAYVGGFDHKLHAIDAFTGQRLWTFQAGAGFDTNPLVVEGKVFAGNRDGRFYAVHANGPNAGSLAWSFQTGGPIHFSAAYQDGIVYFASNDSHAYALRADNGDLVWKSDKLPGQGFHSWWPVIYGDWVIFAGSNSYRFNAEPGGTFLHNLDEEGVYPNRERDPRGTLVGFLGKEPGDWVPGTPTLDTSRSNSKGTTRPITEYLEANPWRRTVFVLNRATGQEYTSDFDRDGKPEYAPFLWFGTQGAGNRYPPVVGGDGVLYMSNNYKSDPHIAGGHLTGWKVGSPFISLVSAVWNAVDEPIGYSAGGSTLYWNRCCDRTAGGIDLSTPYESIFASQDVAVEAAVGASDASTAAREWNYFSYDLDRKIPGYNEQTYAWDPYHKPFGGVYGGRIGYYGFHGDTNAPVPYNGKIFMHRGNAIIAFGTSKGNPVKLPTVKKVSADAFTPAIGQDALKATLTAEVQKMLDAGHLQPGYLNHGLLDQQARRTCGDNLLDYYHQPGETIVTLIQALPYLSPDMQQKVRSYIRSEFEAYPPYQYNHIGYRDGAARDDFLMPPDIDQSRKGYGPQQTNYEFSAWKINPYAFYAMWKYAAEFGEARTIFDQSKKQLSGLPDESYLLKNPHVHNAFIAGYMGYLELQKLAGYPESADVRSDLNYLLNLRAKNFSTELPAAYFEENNQFYCRALSVSRNFIYMVPELAQYLRDHALEKVQSALQEYERVAPYWFVSRAEVAYGEGIVSHLYDRHSLFQAKAYIMNAPQSELLRYLDVPAYARGDLYYIQNVIAAIRAGS